MITRPSEYQPTVLRFGIAVPRGPLAEIVAPRSAVVCFLEPSDVPAAKGHHFGQIAMEGAIYQDEKPPFLDLLGLAAGRLSENAPSMSLQHANRDHLTIVGRTDWDPALRCWVVSEIANPAAAEEWLGEPLSIGPSTDQLSRAAGLIYTRDHSPQMMMLVERTRLMGGDVVAAVIERERKRILTV